MVTRFKVVERPSCIRCPPEFWNASSPSENGSVDQSEDSGPKGQLVPTVAPALDLLGGPLKQGKLCFINPLFLQLEVSRETLNFRPVLTNCFLENYRSANLIEESRGVVFNKCVIEWL